MNVLLFQEQYCCQCVDDWIAPSLIEEAARLVKIVEERLVLFASEE
jgi:hypothetical protein